LAFDLGLFGEQILAVLKDDNSGFQQILKKVGFSHEQLRLQLAHLENQGTQEDQKHVYTSKLSPN